MHVARLTRFVGLLGALASCHEPSPAAPKTITVPKAAAAAPPLVVAPAAPARGEFSFVVASHDEHPLTLHVVGDRTLVARGTGIWGYATKDRKLGEDKSLGAGLPTTGPNHVERIGGVWPDVALVHGSKEFSHYAGPDPVVFVARGGTFVVEPATLDEVPRGIAHRERDTFLFLPSPSHYMDGAPNVLENPSCKAKNARADSLVYASRAGKKAPVPKVPASFFQQRLAQDGDGTPWVVGADVCAPGAYVGMLGPAFVAPEKVPGSDACTTIDEVEGTVLTRAALFPAPSGIFVVLTNHPSPIGDKPTSGPCTDPPRLLHRDRSGAWSKPRALPAVDVSHPYVDPAGTYWGITERGTVLRAGATGEARELSLGLACTSPLGENGRNGKPLSAKLPDAIVELVVPFPDRPMVVLAYDDEQTHGLCAIEP